MILERIVAETKSELIHRRRTAPIEKLLRAANDAPAPRGLAAALGRGTTVQLIAEVKHKSPSKGVLRADFDPVSLARSYWKAGAGAISVLTDGPFFGGSLEHLKAVREAVPLPILRKDFIVDTYQVVEARAAGADGLLLIAAALSQTELERLLAETRAFGMDALVEVHTEDELDRALAAGGHLIGINNRDLRTFRTSLDVTNRLAGRVPGDVVLVSESGIASRDDVARVAASGVDAVLVGERLVTSADPMTVARELLGVPITGRPGGGPVDVVSGTTDVVSGTTDVVGGAIDVVGGAIDEIGGTVDAGGMAIGAPQDTAKDKDPKAVAP